MLKRVRHCASPFFICDNPLLPRVPFVFRFRTLFPSQFGFEVHADSLSTFLKESGECAMK